MAAAISTDELLARLGPDERAWIIEFRDQLRERLGPRLRDLRLFGSTVRGDTHDESDVDVLVLLDGYDGETARVVTDTAGEISGWLAPFIQDFDRYHSPSSRATGFYAEMRRESVRL